MKGGARMKLAMAVRARLRRIPPMRWLALFCVLLLVFSVLPLYAISFYNHPYYDDYNFSADVHAAWLQTRSPLQALRAAWDTSLRVRDTWQGNYTGTFLSTLQPGTFSEQLYYLTTFFLLTAFLLGFGFLLHTVFRRMLGAGRAETAVITSLFLFVATQLIPDPGQAYYWFNGSVSNLFLYSMLAVSFALMLRLATATRGAGWLVLCLFLLTAAQGGCSYSGGLMGVLVYAGVAVFAFLRRHKYRFIYAALAAWFLACFLYSVTAPGNAVRAGLLGATVSAPVAVLKSFYYGVALMGDFFTLPVFAVLLLIAPILYRLAAASPRRFRHPVLVLGAGVCLFCTQLTPPLYAGVFLGDGRAINTFYISFLAMLLGYETYLLGALARRRAAKGLPRVTPTPALRRGLTLAALCLLLTGCLGYKQPDDVLYGPMNLAGGRAALSILTGEAAQYDREMAAREKLLNDPALPVVTLAPVSSTPKVFMADLLAADALYDVRPTLCRYYGKTAIDIAEGGGQ